MKSIALLRVVVIVLAALAAGCAAAQTVKPYISLMDMDQAKTQAGLVVEGEVTETEATDTYLAAEPETFAHPLGTLVNEYAYKTRATVKVTKPIKGVAAAGNPVEFWFLSPESHTDPAVLLGRSLPPVMEGDRLRVFLEDRDGEWWLIAHERWYRDAAFQPYEVRGRVKQPGARYVMIPGEAVPGAEAGVATAVPGQGAAPGQAAAPGQVTTATPGQGTAPRQATTSRTTQPVTAAPKTTTRKPRFPERVMPDRSWPPPK